MKFSAGWPMLCLRIIHFAAVDVRKGRRGGKTERDNYDSAIVFFRSGYYKMMMDYVALSVPNFDYDGQLLPEGVEDHLIIFN